MEKRASFSIWYFLDTLAKHGVKAITAEGQSFNPERHEAIGVVSDPTSPSDTVVRVEQKGYTFGDKLLRPARVIVNKQMDK